MRLYTKDDTIGLLNISLSKLDGLIRTKQLKHYKLNRQVRFSEEHINEYLQNMEIN